MSDEPKRRVETIRSRLTGLAVTLGVEAVLVASLILLGLALAAIVIAIS